LHRHVKFNVSLSAMSRLRGCLIYFSLMRNMHVEELL